ncbi:MAG TPA: carbamoyltransferase C-terminal domain-containing protein [Gaiellaceae bacterium]
MIVLGVTDPVGDDNAAAILVNGELVAMVEEERLTRVKHARSTVPRKAIEWCLAQAGCTLSDVDFVAVGHSDPSTTFRDAALLTVGRQVRRRPVYRDVVSEAKMLRRHRYHVGELMSVLGPEAAKNVRWVRHHLAHAASAFLVSPFERANIVSLDGSGGQDAGLLAVGSGTGIEPVAWVEREASWGVFYEGFTAALGFRQHSDEGKVMGLAAYGGHADELFDFIDLDGPDGWPTYDRRKMYRHLATIRPRARFDDPINGYHEHIAARLQYSLEVVVGRMTEVLHQRNGLTDFCLAGGVALNCSCNGRLLSLPHVERLFVQPAASDAGTALGAAAHVYTQQTGKRPRPAPFAHPYWGPEYTNDEIESDLHQSKLDYRRSDDVGADAAKLIADDNIVGWFQGRMEVGPRALGARSILANPTNPAMKDAVNKNVKFREPWRPFAPSILGEHMHEYFGTEHPSPFMILAFEAEEAVRSRIPAALHVDNTGRPQTVTNDTNPKYWHLIDEFRKLTGVPVVLNTSFNVDSEPIVCTPRNALATFAISGMDALAIGDFIVEKKQNGSSR